MTTQHKIGYGVLALLVFWHLQVTLASRYKVVGPFMSKPKEAGYVWQDTHTTDSRFFWQHTDLIWQAGIPHPEFKAETGKTVGMWEPMPGYKFINRASGLATKWEAELVHPDYMAWSDHVEGLWIPVTGYKFIYEGDTFVGSVWDPGKRYDDLKVSSLQTVNAYSPYPGYSFVDPTKSLKVAWTPGLVNSENRKLIAGQKEGSWIVSTGPATARPRYARRGSRNGRDARLFFGGVATGVLLRSL